MGRSGQGKTRSGISTPVIVVGSLLGALSLTAFGDSQAQAQRTDPRKHARLVPAHDATELRILDWALWNVSKSYVEPERIDPSKMTLAGLEALESTIAEVLVQPLSNSMRVKVQVGTEVQEFQTGDVEALWAVGPHIREVFRFINRHTELTDEEQRNAEYAIVAGVLSTLDPHTNLLRPSDFADMKTSTKGSFGGLGIEVRMRDGTITVVRVISGNPASKVDMRPGDRIVQIDAESTVTMTLNEAVGRLRGPPGTTVDVYVMREGLKSPKRLPITRATIHLDSVVGELLSTTNEAGEVQKVGLVQIPRNFAQTTGRELREKLNEFEQAEVEGIILDLRDNPGGLLNAAVEVANAFLSSGTIVSTVGRGTRQAREVESADSRYDFPDKPLVVLVDQGSASASEIVAGALRNQGRAVVIGRRTFGKGSVQVLHDRKVGDDELALKLTIAQYLTPGDVSIQSVGVAPDLETIPVWIGTDQIDYFGVSRFDLLREESLASHLVSASASARASAYGPLYFLTPGSINGSEDAKGKKPKPKDPPTGENLLRDPEIRIARDLVLWAQSSDRDRLLSQMDEFVVQQQEIEQERIATSLEARGIDWRPSPKPAENNKPRLRVNVATNRADNVIRGGERGTVTLTVTNTGTTPASQVRAITNSDYRYFDERELLFGRIEPGASKSYSLPLSVSEHELSRTDRIDFHLFEQHGAILEEDSELHLDIAAEGLPRPQFAYGYQIVDDPSAGSNIVGNGNGMLEVGERVSLRVNVANQGEGPALDTWVTLRNRSGEAVFLHTGRERLKEIPPGGSRTVDLDVELRGSPEFDEAQFQLTVSDNKIAEALSERIVFDVGDSGTSVEPIRAGATTLREVDLYAAPQKGARLVGHAGDGAKFQITGETDGWYRISGGSGLAFVRQDDIEKTTKAPRSIDSFKPTYMVSPPRISLVGAVTQTEGTKVHFGGVAIDEDAVRDVFITVYNPSRNLFGDREKVFYQANEDAASGKLEFAADVPLTPGNNLIEVHARQNDDVVAVKRMWVLRTSGLAEARAKEHDFRSKGQLRVDTLR